MRVKYPIAVGSGISLIVLFTTMVKSTGDIASPTLDKLVMILLTGIVLLSFSIEMKP